MAGRVLVVEDDDDLRGAVAATLRHAGLCLISAITAEDALALLEDERCDLVVLDVHLPGLSRLETLGVIVAKWPRLPVIVASAAGDMGEPEARARGARGFLRKPFSWDQLLERIANALAPARRSAPPAAAGKLCMERPGRGGRAPGLPAGAGVAR